MSNGLRLNLGSGQNRLPGFVNVDKFGQPDVRWDLEQFPWPWEDHSVVEVVLNHVLEHLGESTAVYIGVFKELYRIGSPGARIHIHVPHPRHDDFLSDPTHVRSVTPDGLLLFSRAANLEWAARGIANSPLALYHEVDFRMLRSHFVLEADWLERMRRGELSQEQIFAAVRKYNNVVKEIQITLEVVKGSTTSVDRPEAA
jgi:hypothetical protein